ncbi:MAG: glycerate kinase [Dehalococcoidales bacterium]|nr:glycerate kinase [Dehalococcoidales bacterium]
MKIVIAPQGFKGNLNSRQVGLAIENGIKRVLPGAETIVKPMADGGEGTAQTLVEATGGRLITTEATGPLSKPVSAQWGLLGDKATAVIETAAASGLTLVPTEQLNPLSTTTYGTGELILAALDHGCRELIIGIGGSATNDGGAGMAQALGVQLLDSRGMAVPFGGAALAELEHVDVSRLDPRLANCKVLLACDVTNPLCGIEGASAVYGPQKGATPEMVSHLNAALSHYADVIYRDLGVDFRNDSGAGAAGGLGMGLMVFLKAEVMSGIGMVIRSTGLTKELEDADLVFTAEGRIDSQTVRGKTPVGIARKAKEFGLPVIALAGEVADGYQAVYQQGIDAVFSITPGPISLDQSLAQAEKLVANVAENTMRLYIKRPE